ncbi:hypothetical protein [Pinisolibacter aquiterrae]|jgi:hypothetical protein|uniref:hypothetical protein n=1 Tax=Pinisolibacter aquiterrae TaxID=2815579 RepID=UPI001C3C97B0|nr:hypothetical protein [Pinisolibacter aquiterrae]MBV5263058.1 hypothetical protein [Pinisolibacter aquiterrae]MCC8233974.1 hypothetical protein [Pinisolibacter aquiterrae]
MIHGYRAVSIAVVAAFVSFGVGSASAKTDQEKAVKECRKEMDWPNLPGKVKKSPMKIAELDACVKRKMGR